MGVDLEVTVASEPFRVISIMDGCIDQGESQLAEYVKTRDLKHLRLVEGEDEKPWWFYLRALEDTLVKRLRGKIGPDIELLCEEAFRYALVGVENVTYKDADRDERRPVVLRWHREEGLPRRLTDDIVHQIHRALRLELGLVALQRCMSSDDIEKNSSAHTLSSNSKGSE